MSTSNLIPAGIWVRVSSGGQDEANQVPDLERYCAERGYAIAKRYELHDKSAYKGEQEARQQEALADTRAGHIKVLTVWASDRLERRGAEATLRIFRLFRDAGGQVESVLEPFLNTGDAELMQAITGWKDKQESARKSERVLAGLNRIKENEALQGRPGWGYETAGQKYRRRLVPTPKGRKYAPLIYERIAGGESLSTVARWLDEQGVRPACTRKKRGRECRTCNEGGHRWWPRTLGVWVRNPANFGYRCAYEDPKRRTHGKVLHRIAEPLVDAALWKRANDRLDKVPGKRAPAAPGNRAMLTGVIFCPRCADSPLYRIKAACGLFYRCSGRGANRKGCGNMVPLAEVDAAVCQIAAATFKWQKVTVTKLIPGSNHEAELAEIAFQLRQLGADFAAERVSDEDYAQRFAGLVAERKRLKALPAIADTWAEIELDETYADRWDALEPSERGPWLQANGFRAEASRDGLKLSQPGHPKQVTATVTFTGEKAAA